MICAVVPQGYARHLRGGEGGGIQEKLCNGRPNFHYNNKLAYKGLKYKTILGGVRRQLVHLEGSTQ